jgi:hypothetical protein
MVLRFPCLTIAGDAALVAGLGATLLFSARASDSASRSGTPIEMDGGWTG